MVNLTLSDWLQIVAVLYLILALFVGVIIWLALRKQKEEYPSAFLRLMSAVFGGLFWPFLIGRAFR